MKGSGCCSTAQSCGPRGFWTKEERVEMLQDYKDSLEKEAQGVEEKIRELKKVS